jgi:serine/threonine protein kinase
MAFIDRYDNGLWHIESKLGEGAFGVVYKISKEEHGFVSAAALKVIPVPQSGEDIQQLKSEGIDEGSISEYIGEIVKDVMQEIRFVHEFEGTANIVSYEDYRVIEKEDEPGYYILMRMELLESLEKVLAARKLGEADAAKVGIDICKALELLEKNKVIHRDIKPGNIMLSKHGDYKLGDFGIARQIERTSGLSQQKGTYNYMAPEVYRGQEYGSSVDLYSLGLVLYRIMNNGRLPFIPADAVKISVSDREEAFLSRMKGEALPPPANASDRMAYIILRACAYDREQRYQRAFEMRSDLESLLHPWPERTESVKPVAQSAAPKPAVQPSAPKPVAQPPAPKPAVQPPLPKPVAQPSAPKPAVQPPLPKPVAQPVAPKPAVQPVAPKPVAQPVAPRPVARSPLPKPVAQPLAPKSAEPPKPPMSPDTRGEPPKQVTIAGRLYRTSVTRIEFESTKLSKSDLLLLSQFKKLKELEICSCEIEDLRPLPALYDLAKLDLNGNQITDLRPLAKMYSLTSLDLGKNQIADVRPLAMLFNLHSLGLYCNQITDVRPLSGLRNLSSLFLLKNQIADIGPLSGLRNLTTVQLDDNRITDVSPLSGMNNLARIQLDDNQITDVRPLSGLQNLTYLSLSGNEMTDVRPLSGLYNLAYLDLNNNPIKDLTPLHSLTKLTQIYLSGVPASKTQMQALKNALPKCSIY